MGTTGIGGLYMPDKRAGKKPHTCIDFFRLQNRCLFAGVNICHRGWSGASCTKASGAGVFILQVCPPVGGNDNPARAGVMNPPVDPEVRRSSVFQISAE